MPILDGEGKRQEMVIGSSFERAKGACQWGPNNTKGSIREGEGRQRGVCNI